MKIKDFAIERYFAKYEFETEYLLSCSDCDGFSMEYLLSLASPGEKRYWNNLKLGYTDTKGSKLLRDAIARHYHTIGHDNIVVSSPGEANFILMNLLLEKGDNVVCMAPAYQSLYQVAESIGCSISFWEAEKCPDWYYDPEKLKELITPETKLIIVNFPHNPTGFVPEKTEWEMIVETAGKNGVVLFSDEMYRGLAHGHAEEITPACDLYENGVSLWGMSKSFGLAGLRTGWLACPNTKLLNEVEAFKDYLSICGSPLNEILSAIALNNSKKFITPNLEKIERNIQIFRQFHQRNRWFCDFPEPVGGSTAFVRILIKEPAMEFAEKLVRETGIMVLPSETFNYGNKHIRIGFGRENFPEVLDKFEKYIRGKIRQHPE